MPQRGLPEAGAMFTKSQRFYDALYGWKDYAEEARRLKRIIAQQKRSAGHALLDVACGTGGHVPYLRDAFEYAGLDLDPEMLGLARKRFPEAPFQQGNMSDFVLGRRFDVIICLFGSTAHVQTFGRLRQALPTLGRQLCPRGLPPTGPFPTP